MAGDDGFVGPQHRGSFLQDFRLLNDGFAIRREALRIAQPRPVEYNDPKGFCQQRRQSKRHVPGIAAGPVDQDDIRAFAHDDGMYSNAVDIQ